VSFTRAERRVNVLAPLFSLSYCQKKKQQNDKER
jgi:hypothetical protein